MGATTSSTMPKLPVVAKLDLSRYQGLWYELARMKDTEFEYGCTWATAKYTLQPDGTMRLINTCYAGEQVATDRFGMERRDGGTARLPDPRYPGRLLVKFDRFPFFEGEYLVHWTDYDNYALVGSSNRRYLWLLSRQRPAPRRNIEWLMNWARYLGYDPRKLIADPMGFSDQATLKPGQPEPLYYPPGWK